MAPKHIVVTTLVFQGRVASSVTWPFYSPHAFSYWCSIRTYIPYNLYCVGGDVKHCSIQSNPIHSNRVSIFSRFRDIWPQNPKHTHRHTPQVILYSVPCNVLALDRQLAYRLGQHTEKTVDRKITSFVQGGIAVRNTKYIKSCSKNTPWKCLSTIAVFDSYDM